ncbi:MAG: ABC transporter ATP-binding protein [Caldilineae bacterium]|nr:ABC transporter ATP-binding protein [Caldilineae bacterium]
MTATERRRPLPRLLAYARPHRGRIWIASAFSVLNKLFDLAPPVLIGAAVDVVVQQEHSWLARFGVVEPERQLILLAALTALIWICESVFEYLFSVAWRNLAQDLQHDLRMDAYAHVQDLELAYYEDRSTGGLLAILNDDINQLERFLDGGANDILQLVTTVLAIGGLFLYLAPGVAWPAMLPMPFIIWGSLRYQRFLEPRYAAVRERVSVLSGLLANNLSGIVTIKSFAAEPREVERVEIESRHYAEANRAAIRLSSAFTPLIRMLIVLGFIAMLVLGGRQVLAGTLDVGAYSVMVFMIQRLLWPLTRLGQTLDQYQRAMASTTRVMDLLDTPVGIVGGRERLAAGAIRGEIRFEDVDFAYSDGRPVIEGLRLEMPAGDTVAIVGPTGSGKTTLIKLLLRFYDPTAGRITLDGQDLRALELSSLRSAIGLVSQDVYLFHGSVRENIAYGRPEASEAEVVEAAKVAEAHDFILQLPQGYDTLVGERGQKLSGGQRQRISIARAVLVDPPVLVLDEATSSVDNETEAAIQRSLERIAVGRTTIVIAHRLSTVRRADRTYVLEAGRLREAGTHEELVARGGIYAGLWAVQTGERVAAD